MRACGARLAIILSIAACVRSAHAQQPDSSATDPDVVPVACGACIGRLAIGLHSPISVASADTGRPQAIEYSDAYAIRLKIHQVGSYIALPLFAAEYFLGEKLLADERNARISGVPVRSSVRGAHSTVATGLGVVFTANTITGVWNLIESRREPAGRTRRWAHSLSMLLADAGFLLTAQAAADARESNADADRHRNLAIGSLSLAAASTIMMWLWKD